MVHRLLKDIFNLLHSAIFGSLLKIEISLLAEICSDDFFAFFFFPLGKRSVVCCEKTPYPHLGTEIGLYRNFPHSCTAEHWFLPFWDLLHWIAMLISISLLKFARLGKEKKRQFYSAIIWVPVNIFICSAPYCDGADFVLVEFLSCARGGKMWTSEPPVQPQLPAFLFAQQMLREGPVQVCLLFSDPNCVHSCKI